MIIHDGSVEQKKALADRFHRGRSQEAADGVVSVPTNAPSPFPKTDKEANRTAE